jgi:hypothetical protein
VGFGPALAVPSITRRLGGKFFVGFVVTAGVFIAPYAMASGEYLASLASFLDSWSFMRGPYALFEAALPSAMAARYAVAGVLLFIMGWTTFQRYRPERSLLRIIGSCLILSPGAQPWYFLWILPLAALRANGTWLLITGLGFLGYAGFAKHRHLGSAALGSSDALDAIPGHSRPRLSPPLERACAAGEVLIRTSVGYASAIPVARHLGNMVRGFERERMNRHDRLFQDRWASILHGDIGILLTLSAPAASRVSTEQS